MQVSRSLLRNREIKLERYLEKLISPVMTCIVTKRLGAAPCEDHWSVRAAAADVLAEMCATFGDRFPNIPHRIVRQFVKALKERSKSLPCHYGERQDETASGLAANLCRVDPPWAAGGGGVISCWDREARGATWSKGLDQTLAVTSRAAQGVHRTRQSN